MGISAASTYASCFRARAEEVKVVVKARSKGTFIVKPRVLYIDDTGKYKSYEPEPATITVKELGIKGWLKGES